MMTDLRIHLAVFRLWLHRQMASAPQANHEKYLWHDRHDYEPMIVGCSCGRVYWRKDDRND
jgi:hypothetical protein